MTLSVSDLAGRFSGQLLQPADAGFDDARRVHNGFVDKHPALIARCRNTADIADAVQLARDSALEVAVKGGGHNVAGRSAVEGGLLIDLSLMRGIHVDAKARTARAQGGATWGDYNRETQLHGLASTGGTVSTTGVSGLTLGGGLGWLMPKYGIAVDNLRSAQIVTADGRVLEASRSDNADLFWAIRGGGGNFGIAASLEFDVHPVGPMIAGGLVAHPFANGRDVWRMCRDLAESGIPDELMLFPAMLHAPDGTKLAGIGAAHCGPLADGEATLRRLKTYGTPAMDALGPIPYSAQNQLLDAAFPKGALNYWKTTFLTSLSDGAIDTLIDCYARVPSPMSLIGVEHFHGAATRVAVGDTAFPHRTYGYNLLVIAEWMNPADSERNIAWARETIAAMKPFSAASGYQNYMAGDEEGDAAATAYGSNYARLRQIKAKYDPTNFFHMNQNIKPAT
jgi:FAD/FMN-containing dehydrogenase